jgi:hypothetical protein
LLLLFVLFYYFEIPFLKDVNIKVCGPAELRTILIWRKKLLADIKKDAKARLLSFFITKTDIILNYFSAGVDGVEKEAVEPEETAEEKEIREIDQLIQNAKADERSKLRK